jgi:uncharacterized integral membrane protein (TIGR00698 family)
MVLGALLALTPLASAAAALVGGAVIALTFGNPVQAMTHRWTHRLLPLAVVGLGAEMNLGTVARVGLHGIGYTAISLAFVMATGLLLGRFLKVDRDAGLLISIGTAICGGSAIAAAAPVLRARPHQVSVALATVFLLNGVALVLFPPMGHLAGLSQNAFGLWAALAIHDTSSVVGAGLAYGPRALAVATTVKLARALWIVPMTLGLGFWVARRQRRAGAAGTEADSVPVKKPWFIGGFLLVAALDPGAAARRPFRRHGGASRPGADPLPHRRWPQPGGAAERRVPSLHPGPGAVADRRLTWAGRCLGGAVVGMIG